MWVGGCIMNLKTKKGGYMSKKVLILSSSPRKGGNSDFLSDKFMEGALAAGNEVEKIFLKDKKVNYCIGCGLCTTNGYSGCSQNDDMAEILDKMIAADVIVLATPVYFYTMCAQLKTVIDRCCAKYTKIVNKEFYFIATAGEGEEAALDGTFDSLRCFLACLEGSEEKGVIKGHGLWTRGEAEGSTAAIEAYDLGKSI